MEVGAWEDIKMRTIEVCLTAYPVMMLVFWSAFALGMNTLDRRA